MISHRPTSHIVSQVPEELKRGEERLTALAKTHYDTVNARLADAEGALKQVGLFAVGCMGICDMLPPGEQEGGIHLSASQEEAYHRFTQCVESMKPLTHVGSHGLHVPLLVFAVGT